MRCSDEKNLYGLSTDTLQNNQEISYVIANEAREDGVETGVRDVGNEQRSRFCPLFYLLILPLYTVLAALLFHLCEYSNSNKLTNQYMNRCISERDHTIAELEKKYRVLVDPNTTRTMLSFEDIRDAIMKADNCLRNTSYSVVPKKITYAKAGIYTVNLLTTVGYGDVVPFTIQGRIVSMLCGAIGIPLYIAFNADLGEWLSGLLVKFYCWIKRICRKLFRRREPTLEERLKPVGDMTKLVIVFALIVIFLLCHGYITMHIENATRSETKWSYIDSVYFLFTSITLVGFGDLVIYNSYVCIFFQIPLLLIGEAIVALYYYYIQNAIRYKIPGIVQRWYRNNVGKPSKRSRRSKRNVLKQNLNPMISDTATAIERQEAQVHRDHKRRSRRRLRKLRDMFLGRKDSNNPDNREADAILLPSNPVSAVSAMNKK